MKIPSKFWHSITYSLLFLLVIVHPSKYGVGVFCFAIVPKSTNNQYSALSSNISTPQTHAAFSSPRNKKNKSSSALSLVPPNSCGGTSLGATAQSSEYGGASKKDDEVGIWPCYDELDKRIISVALPCIANYAITPLVGAVDLFWVGRMGNALAIAGQSAANQVFSSTFWLASYLPSVTATLVSKENAKGDEDGVQTAVCQALFIAFILAIAGTAFIILRPDFVLKSVLAKDAAAIEFARPYLLIRAFAFFPALVTTIAFSAFRGILDTVTPLKISLFANAFNAVLDPIMIFNCKMGVTGAALATLAAEIVSAVAFTRIMLKQGLIRWSKLFKLPRWSTLKPLLQGGAALQLRNLALNITFLSVARVTQSIDNTGVSAAAHSIALQVFQVGGIVLLALSTVAQSLVPNEMVVKIDPKTGKRSGGRKAARALVNRMMSLGFLLGAALGALQILILPMIHKFTPLKEVQEAARLPSYIASFLQIINGLVFIGEGVMIGCGNFLTLSFSTVVATCGILTALRVFPQKFGVAGVWMGFGVFNALRLLGVIVHQTQIAPIANKNLDKTK